MSAEFVKIPVELNRASLGESDRPYVVIKGGEGFSGTPAYPSIDLITIDEQKLSGGTFEGYLTVAIIAENGDEVCADVESEGKILRFWVDRSSGKVLKKVEMIKML